MIKEITLFIVSANRLLLLNLIQRILGFSAFFLLAFQIFIGAFKLNSNLHKFNGFFVYLLIFFHPISYLLFSKILYGKLDFFRIYVDACLYCKNINEFSLSLGIIGFWIISAGFVSGFLTKWKNIHFINYFVFYLISFHGFFLGSDIKPGSLFFYLYIVAHVVVIISIWKKKKEIYRSILNLFNLILDKMRS